MRVSKDELITTKQLCDWLRISNATASRWKSQGMPYVETDKEHTYRKSDVLKWIANLRDSNDLTDINCTNTTVKLISENELCEWLKINPVTTWRWRKEGMPYFGRKKTIRYNKKQVINWLTEHGRW